MHASCGLAVAALVLSCFGPAHAQSSSPANPFEGDAKAVEAGQSLFNQNCERCHGPNAVTALMPRNLRRLRARHGGDMAASFYATVQAGRPAKGMPSWKGVIDDGDLWRIYTFLESVQESP